MACNLDRSIDARTPLVSPVLGTIGFGVSARFRSGTQCLLPARSGKLFPAVFAHVLADIVPFVFLAAFRLVIHQPNNRKRHSQTVNIDLSGC